MNIGTCESESRKLSRNTLFCQYIKELKPNLTLVGRTDNQISLPISIFDVLLFQLTN